MLRTEVTPAARNIGRNSSPVTCMKCAKCTRCTCASISPGITNFPLPSIVWASCGMAIGSCGELTARMVSPSITIVHLGSMLADVESKSVVFLMTRVVGSSAWSCPVAASIAIAIVSRMRGRITRHMIKAPFKQVVPSSRCQQCTVCLDEIR